MSFLVSINHNFEKIGKASNSMTHGIVGGSLVATGTINRRLE